ncbi:SH3 and multiple ankyrin repeat domains protein 2-like isoform X1 [Dreissena polymorpha]|uniref:SH3 and multiple ankyrin repeat domains protein 2-like isoform X1 n=1 Tax=Dreissena polymorpha TaxID=45954 RepID=UPI002264242B|nr:SH3 and multiple ankyrin repeat domains protein 2-like isoform X1 [Dreissena polymorpha]
MSQKAIKKKQVKEVKHAVSIAVKSIKEKEESNTKQPPKSLPEKSFPLNKFIALPLNGLRPKSSHNTNEISKPPRKNLPVKAIAIPPGTSSNDRRAQVYIVDKPEGSIHDLSSEPFTIITTINNTDFESVNHQTLSTGKGVEGSSVYGGVGITDRLTNQENSKASSEPFATSTPRVSRRGLFSAQNSPLRDKRGSSGSVNSTDSYQSVASADNTRKRRYKKRSQSAPVDQNRRKLQDTDYVLRKWSDNESIPGLVYDTNTKIVQDGIVIHRENWTSAKTGLQSTGAVQTIYRSNSANRLSQSGDEVKPPPQLNGSVYSEVEFTNLISHVQSSEGTDSQIVKSCDNSFQHGSLSSNDPTLDNYILTGIEGRNNPSHAWDSKTEIVNTKGTLSHNGFTLVRSKSDCNMNKANMEFNRDRNMSSYNSNTYVMNGTPQSGIVIRKPGGDNIMIDDMHGRPLHSDYYGQEFYTIGRKQGTLMQSRQKFSSMPTLLTESKGDKKLLKLLKKQEKEEKKRREKEEKKRAKEEKKRLKLEKKLKIKTLPRNFERSSHAFTNGHVLSQGMENMYRRPKLSMTAVNIDIDGDDNVSVASRTPAPKMAPPPLPGPSQKTMALYASAPDLLRIEQVYGATLRGTQKEQYTRPSLNLSDYGPRTVVLQRAPEGYGFVLRGAKSQMRPNGDLDFRPTPEFPALQYLDSVDPGSVSDRAGLKGGDFILEINGENVVRASHDRVVHLIRSTGNTLAMKVVTVQLGNRGQDWFINEQDRNLTMPNRQKKKAAPMPPHRDPRTSLSISKSEGQAMAEEMAAMAKLDLAIGEKREEEKIASIRSRTAAKRVSVVDIENMGVEGKLERAKSTPDLLEANKVTKHYATPTVPDDHRKYVITSSGSTSPSGAVSRPKAAPPVPPGADNSPKKQAPRPPSEVVTINTNMGSPYASSKVVVTSTTKSDYESSFRPGDSAKLADEPNEGPKGHNRSPSAGAVLVRQGGAVETEKTNVSFADDKVLDRAASFLKKHPNAKLLMTAKGQESLRNRTSMRMSLHSSEPDPDYDSDSGDEKPDSPRKTQDPKTQSVTVISVGDQNKKMAPAPSQAAKRYTIHSSIPSDDKGFVIPPKPDVPAPSPPVQARHESPKKSSSSPQQSNRMAVKVEINTRQFDSEPPQLPSTPPPDFIGSGPLINIPKAPAPPALVSNGTPPPPPPPPPPPAPTSEEIRKTKSSASMDYISTSVPHNAIAAAVAKRQERLQNGGPQMAEVKAKPEIPQMDPTQAAIIAAVMKRRQQLEKQDENMVIDSIESRLQKTKKLQAAKFSLAGNKPLKTEAKPNEGNKPVSPVQSSVKPLGPKTSPAPVKMEKEEFSFKVEPVKEINTINKNQPGLTQIKPNFSSPAKNTKPVIETKQTNGISKGKPVEGLNIKPLEKSSTTTSESNKSSERLTTAMVETNNNTSDNGKTDYLALAEKKRLEWLQKKQKSSESKSSPSGTPERDLVKSKTVEINGKPKPLSNGDVYKNVPPPPLGFRDGGKTNANIVQLEIIPPPEHFSSDGGSEPNTQQNSPAFSPDTASLVSSLSTLSSLSGEGRSNGYEELIAPPPPGFGDDSSSYIPPPPEFGNVNVKKTFSDKAIDQWFGNDVLDWLDSLNMSQYKASFQRNSVDGKKLLDLSRDNYIDLGVTQVGHRMTIERAIKKAEIKQKTSHEVIAVEHL